MPRPETDLTGNARFKEWWPNLGNRGLILEVEYEIERDPAMGGNYTEWRLARERDLYFLRWMRKDKGLEPLL